MYRATTPKHTFIFDVDPAETFDKILITYAQNGKIILEKNKEELSFSETMNECCGRQYTASLELTQEETNMFSAGSRGVVSIQVRVRTYDGQVLASDEKHISVKNVLNDEVLL